MERPVRPLATRATMAGLTLALLVGASSLAAIPAHAVTEEDLRNARLAFEVAQAELEAETWNLRTLRDTGGLARFEYEEFAAEVEPIQLQYLAVRSAAVRRSVELHVGARPGDWAADTIARTYLAAAVEQDRQMLATRSLEVDRIEADLALLRDEAEGFEAARSESEVRLEILTQQVQELDQEFAELALRYEAEMRTTTTSTLTPPSTTTTVVTAPTSTSVPATTTTVPVATTTTVEVPTTSTVPDSTTSTLPTTTTSVVDATTTTTVFTPPPDGLTCPVAGPHHFVDSFGAPRSGGRTHAGVDMMADRGTPLVAIESGTVGRMASGGLGGITVWLIGAGGDEYYYAHLDGWAEDLHTGQVLAVGDLLGYVGSTGNAPDAYPHLHFEIHPDGGAAVNPYPIVASLCD